VTDWEALKDKYNWIAYCPKKNQIYLVKDCHLFQGEEWYTYADSKLFGKFIRVSKASTWTHIGKVDKSIKYVSGE
jgi:hypothetical protein